jgi:hypothetical protein
VAAELAPLTADVARAFLERRFRQVAKTPVRKAWEAGKSQ